MQSEAQRSQLSHADLPVFAEEVFVSREFLDGKWAAGVELVGGDSDFRAEAEFAAVLEVRAGVSLFTRFRNGAFRRGAWVVS